jgi:hypothetical protein
MEYPFGVWIFFSTEYPRKKLNQYRCRGEDVLTLPFFVISLVLSENKLDMLFFPKINRSDLMVTVYHGIVCNRERKKDS